MAITVAQSGRLAKPDAAGAAQRADRALPPLRAPRRAPRGGGRRAAASVRGPALLGPAAAGLRRPAGAAAPPMACGCATPTSRRRSAARRRTTSRCRPRSWPAVRIFSTSWACSTGCASSSAWGASAGRPICARAACWARRRRPRAPCLRTVPPATSVTASRSSPATTRASRTPSPASSRARCFDPSSSPPGDSSKTIDSVAVHDMDSAEGAHFLSGVLTRKRVASEQ